MNLPLFTRRSFLASAATLAAVTTGRQRLIAQRAPAFDVTEKTIAELQAAMAAGQVTAAQLVALYLARIDAYDQAGPRLNAVLHVNPNAAADAAALDAERRTQGARGPLHGIPVLLKDNFDTRDMPTTGGCLALSNVVPREDAFQVARLRRAGAVLLGKVNLHELALGLTTVSSVAGQTLNPYDLRRAPGGSSGGSGVAAAASFAAFTMGTDTSGSIRIPSAHNSLVGLRPTAGLASRGGIIPFGHTQDTGGPMARTVADIAVVLDATVGYDPGDPITAASKGRIPPTYTSALNRDALKGARIGVLGELFGAAPEDAEVATVVRRAVTDMTSRGATAVDVAIPDLARQLTASNLLSQELKFYLGAYLKASPSSPVKSVEELLASGLYGFPIQGFVEGANALADDYLSSGEYKARLAAREALARAVLAVMDDNRLDVLVYPTTRRVAPLIGGNQAGSNAGLSAQSGFPAITTPAGFTAEGFPVGVEMLARPFAEATLLGLAFAYEAATGHRRRPATTPALTGTAVKDVPAPVSSSDTGPGSVTFQATATGSFELAARLSFNAGTRQLGYELRLNGTTEPVAGVYLHRRGNRPNGGVAHILAKAPRSLTSGQVVLSEAEAADLKAGKMYLAAVSARDVRRSVRADLALPVPPAA
jgi:amidase